MRLSSLYKVTQQQGWCLHPEILTITLGNQSSWMLVTEGFCAWGLGVLAWSREGFLRAEV